MENPQDIPGFERAKSGKVEFDKMELKVNEFLSRKGLYKRIPFSYYFDAIKHFGRSLVCEWEEIRQVPGRRWTKAFGRGKLEGIVRYTFAGKIVDVYDVKEIPVFLELAEIFLEFQYPVFEFRTPNGTVYGPTHPFGPDLSKYV